MVFLFVCFVLISRKECFIFIHLFIFKIYFIYLFLAVLGLFCFAQAFSSCGEQWLLIAEHRSRRAGFSSCGV